MRTWHLEMVFVALVLACVDIVVHAPALEWLGAAAVLLAFAHAQVADRLAEQEAARAQPAVECHRWASRYWVSKELLWFAYFTAHRSWSALVGGLVFMAYPAWRRFYRSTLKPRAL